MSVPMEGWPQRHRITVDEYYRMAEIGVLAPDARVELIEGEIIDMAPIGPAHGSVVDQLTRLLVRAAGDSAIVRIQGAVRLSHITEPEPDVAVLRPRTDFYRGSQPTVRDILLLVEVADSTLRYDRDIKVPLYARYGVAETWVFDLQAKRLITHSAPIDGQYRDTATLTDPGLVALTAYPEIRIDLAGVFGRD
jgi:Uma2 family endonuclease